MKKLLAFGAFAFCAAVLTGCDPSSATSKAASAGASAATAAKDKVDETISKAREEFMKNVDVTKATEAAGKLAGDAKTTAMGKIDELKKLVDEIKAAPTMDRFNELKDKAMKLWDEVKKLVGM